MMRRRPPGPAGLAGPSHPSPGPCPDPSAAVDVQAANEQDDVELDAEALGRLAGAVLAGEGVTGPAELTLTFIDEEAMAALNREHLGESGPTDVLAFPLEDPAELEPNRPPGMVALLGDVVVCPAVAQRYAADHGRSTADELALLVVHGVLHVLGHDHAEAEETARMRARELFHLRAVVDPTFVL